MDGNLERILQFISKVSLYLSYGRQKIKDENFADSKVTVKSTKIMTLENHHIY